MITVVAPASSLSYYFAWLASFAALAAVVAGPIVGVFTGVVLLRGMRHEATCPRCGTGNPRHADSCRACDLAFMSLEGSLMG